MRVLLGVGAVLLFAACPTNDIRRCSEGCLEGSRCDAATQICVRIETPDSGGGGERAVTLGATIGNGGTAASPNYKLEAVIGGQAPSGTASSPQFKLTTVDEQP